MGYPHVSEAPTFASRNMLRSIPLGLLLIAFQAVAQDTVQYFWSGALTAHSIAVRARLSAPSDSVRLLACTGPCANGPAYSAYAIADTSNDLVAALSLDDLEPGSSYRYRFEVNGGVDTSLTHMGRFSTPEAGPCSFSFVVGSCNSLSTHPVWSAMRSLGPLFFLSTGDLHYRDPNSLDLAVHRAPYKEDVLPLSPMKEALHRFPVAYVWDDHDFCGDGSDGSRIGKANAARAYREYVPHYPLHHDKSVYQSFTIGRVHFILSDLRSSKSPSAMMDSLQRSWLLGEFLYARDHGLIAAWVSPLTWNSNGYPENWGCQPAERTALNNFLYHQQVKDLFILSGDAHMLAIDDGSNADFSSSQELLFHYPIFQAAAIARTGSYKGGQFNQGGWYPNPSLAEGQFGEVLVNDDGNEVCITFNGWRTDSMGANVSLINSYTFCRTPALVGVTEQERNATARGFVHDGALELRWSDCTGPGEVELLDLTGRPLTKRYVQWSNGQARITLPFVAQEIVVAHIAASGRSTTLRIFIP